MKDAILVRIDKICKRCGKRETFYSPFDNSVKGRFCRECVAKKTKSRAKADPKKHQKIVLAYKKRVRQLKNYKPAWIVNEHKYWKKWVVTHPDQRRAIAIRSYHKRHGSSNMRANVAIPKA